jgi:hypothetical protein
VHGTIETETGAYVADNDAYEHGSWIHEPFRA